MSLYDEVMNVRKVSIESLKELLDRSSDKYYNEGDSPITDEEFDKMSVIYKSLTGVEYSTITSPKKGKKLVDTGHLFPTLVGTLSKAYDMDEFEIALDKMYEKMGFSDNEHIDILVTTKYDGNSVMLAFDNKGKLNSALTRGKDGLGADLKDLFGDRTIDVKSLKSHGVTMKDTDLLGIKCEALITYENFEKIQKKMNKSYANPRSITAGILNSDDGVLYKDLVSLAPISIAMSDTDVEFDRIKSVDIINDVTSKDKSKFNGVEDRQHHVISGNKSAIISKLSKLYELFSSELRAMLPYMIDGLVIEIVNADVRKKLGRQNDRNNFDIALKFPYMTAKTTVTDIEFYVAKTGRHTPVAVVKPVFFNGAKCDHISLSNYARFNELKLGVGTHVIVEYHADVMSYLVLDNNYVSENNRIKPIPFIDKCITCGSKLTINDRGTFIHCNNPECTSNLVGKIVNWLTKLNIKGIKGATIEKLVEADKLQKIEDLYSLTVDDVLLVDGFKETSAKKVIDAINSRTELLDYELFGSLLFENFGVRKAKELFTKYTIEDLIDFETEELVSGIHDLLLTVDGISDQMANNFINGYHLNKDTIKFILETIPVEYYKEKLAENKGDVEPMVIVFTGFRDKDLQSKLEALGHKVTSSVSKNTDIVLTKDPDGASSKLVKARELGKPIMHVDEFTF